jgi:hypothetical protein
LKKTDPIARGQLRTLNVMAALSFLVVGLLYCYGASTVSTDPLGRGVLFATAGFWTVRALVQGPMFGIRHPVSMLLTAVFLAGALLHAVPAWP